MEKEKSISVKAPKLLSEEMNDFVSRKPHWVLVHGSGIFLLVLVLMVGVLWLIRYPTTISVNATLRYEQTPVAVLSPVTGRIDRFIVKEKEAVEKGQALGYIEALADTERYILRAPVAGIFHFIRPAGSGQLLSSTEPIGFIRQKNDRLIALSCVPQSDVMRIYVGQPVFIQLAAYPNLDYGLVQGKIDEIGELPTDSGFMVHISLPEQIKGVAGGRIQAGERIQYKEGLSANVKIIIENKRLLERFYAHF